MTVPAKDLTAGQQVRLSGTTYKVVAARPRYQYDGPQNQRLRGALKNVSITLVAPGVASRALMALPNEQFEVVS